MRIAAFVRSGQQGWGVILPAGLCPLSETIPTLAEGLAAGHETLAAAVAACQSIIGLEEIEAFAPPLAAASRVFCIGVNYPDHAAETGRSGTGSPAPEWPSIFLRHANSFVGHNVDVVAPLESAEFDYEAELAVVIGKAGRAIAREQAMDHVAGYTCVAENSARDFQRHSRQVTAGKNFDRSGAIGPWIVTRDEAPDPAQMIVTGLLNGDLMQKGRVADLIFPIDALIAYISRFTMLLPGDIIATGTPEGVGSKQHPPRYLQAGDRFAVRVDGVGHLENGITRETERV